MWRLIRKGFLVMTSLIFFPVPIDDATQPQWGNESSVVIFIERHRQWGPGFGKELFSLRWYEGPREITKRASAFVEMLIPCGQG